MLQVGTPQVQRPSRLGRLIAATVCVITLAGVLVITWTSFQDKLHAHTQRHEIIRNLQSIPSLHLRFHLKRPSMYVQGQSDIDVYAQPIASTNSVSYNGISTINVNGVAHKYMLVDGVSYYVAGKTATCLHAQALPPINDLLSAINSATHVDGVAGLEGVQCPRGNMLKVRFAGNDFALCSVTRSGAPGFDIFGSELDIAVTYTSEPVTVIPPTLSPETLSSCGKAPNNVAISPTTKNLLTGAGKDWAEKLFTGTSQKVELFEPKCGCKGPRRPCIFFHGVDETKENGLIDSLPHHWGKQIPKHAPCCTSIKFAQLNTKDFGWTDETLQQKVCNYTLQMSPTSNRNTGSIEDTIIVTHSMGNLMLAGAIANGRCSVSSTSSWVGLGGPMRGSMGSDMVNTICNGGNVGLDIVKVVATLFGQCPACVGRKALVYEGERYCSEQQKKKYGAAQAAYTQSVSAALCSNSYNGVISIVQPALALAGKIIPHKSRENDGVVEFQSCAADLPLDQFDDTYTSRFYKGRLNHLDTSFRNGDAWFDNAKKPLKWFECLL